MAGTEAIGRGAVQVKIIRTWTGAVPAGRADEYLSYLQRTGVRDLRSTPGNHRVQVLRRDLEGVTEFQVVSTWESPGAIRAFAGEPPTRARYYPEDAAFLLAMSEDVEHWQLAVDDG